MKDRINYFTESDEDIIAIENLIHKATLLGHKKLLHEIAFQNSESIPSFGNPLAWYVYALEDVENHIARKNISEKTIQVSITFETKDSTTDSEIEKALVRGIYYGLDVRRISSPKDIKSVTFIHKK